MSSIILKESDSRPYLNLIVNGVRYFALLDSGANKSVIGGKLAAEVQNLSDFRKIVANVRTADGQIQKVIGTVTLNITFQGQSKWYEFLVVPSIQQNMICGYDFWIFFFV